MALYCTAPLSSCKGRPISFNGDDDDHWFSLRYRLRLLLLLVAREGSGRSLSGTGQ